MKFLELTLEQPAANVALDEALIESAEGENQPSQVLRVWESTRPMVVLGRSSVWKTEVNKGFCQQAGIPIIRRCSGGASVLTDKGCLMYAVLLSYDRDPRLRLLNHAHQYVMSRIQTALRQLGIPTEFQGTSDLTFENRKVSGNSLRCKKNWLLYHGTLIGQEMDRSLIGKCLGRPAREPEYRRGRDHEAFIGALPATTSQIARSLYETWCCQGPLEDWPRALTRRLVETKYNSESWNYRI